MTPEGRVKREVSTLLKTFPSVYAFRPVQYGMGAAGLDFHCVVGKYFHAGIVAELVPIAFFIETKRPGEKPTERQREFMKDRLLKQNAKTFVIDEDPSIGKGSGLENLALWLGEIENHNERIRSIIAAQNFMDRPVNP